VFADLCSSQPERDVIVHIENGMVVKGDSAMLQSVLTNLLSNAWKFTTNCERAEITFSYMVEGGKKIFFVEDNGIGFDEKFKDRLFKPFQRLHDTTEFPGTGLGLAIVERIIHRHGGIIWAESEVDEGTSFFFTLNG
jgi:signal transduction histidine kinase